MKTVRKNPGILLRSPVIHAATSLTDAACIAQQGSRYAGSSHDEAVQYFYDLGIQDDDFKKACRRLSQIISEKQGADPRVRPC